MPLFEEQMRGGNRCKGMTLAYHFSWSRISFSHFRRYFISSICTWNLSPVWGSGFECKRRLKCRRNIIECKQGVGVRGKRSQSRELNSYRYVRVNLLLLSPGSPVPSKKWPKLNSGRISPPYQPPPNSSPAPLSERITCPLESDEYVRPIGEEYR